MTKQQMVRAQGWVHPNADEAWKFVLNAGRTVLADGREYNSCSVQIDPVKPGQEALTAVHFFKAGMGGPRYLTMTPGGARVEFEQAGVKTFDIVLDPPHDGGVLSARYGVLEWPDGKWPAGVVNTVSGNVMITVTGADGVPIVVSPHMHLETELLFLGAVYLQDYQQ